MGVSFGPLSMECVGKFSECEDENGMCVCVPSVGSEYIGYFGFFLLLNLVLMNCGKYY